MSRGDRRFCSICQQAEDRSLGHEPKTWDYQGSVGKSVRYQRPTEVVSFSAGLSDSKGSNPSISHSSGFHHSDERHRLRAGGLGYPDTGERGVNTEAALLPPTPQPPSPHPRHLWNTTPRCWLISPGLPGGAAVTRHIYLTWWLIRMVADKDG